MSYHKSHVVRLLKDLKWTPQMPMERATQRDELAITRWQSEVWVEMKKSGFGGQNPCFCGRIGLLPSVRHSQNVCALWSYANLASLSDSRSFVQDERNYSSWLFRMTRDDAMDDFDRVHFLKHLLWQTDSKLLVIWDGLPIHRNQYVKDYLANGATRQIYHERLPAYTPDLNPDEGVWDHLKNVEL